MTDQELKDLVINLAISQKKTDEQISRLEKSQTKTDEQLAKTDEQISKLEQAQEKTDKKLDKVAKMLGNIGNNQGDITEEYFYNSLSYKPVLAGIKYDFIDKNVTRNKNKIEDEYDILLVNGKDIAIIETKYKAHISDLNRLVNKKYINFKELYPEYKNYNHHLALATFHANDDLKREASKNNVVILQRKGDVIETILPK